MIKIRERLTPAFKKHQTAPLVEITITNPILPLAENWNGGWCTLRKSLADFYESVYNLNVKVDDVYVVTFPKCGTTWMQELAWLLLNNLDFEAAKNKSVLQRTIYMERSAAMNEPKDQCVKDIINLKSPRIVKTHLPAHLLPKEIWQKKARVIYCARNPMDVVISFYHYCRGCNFWAGTLDEFVIDFLNNELFYTPYWPHVLDFWHMRQKSNVFFVTYEEMKRDLRGVVIKLNKFLEQPDLNETIMQELLKHLSFDVMKKNKAANPTALAVDVYNSAANFQFMRRGIVGAYKDELSKESQQKIEQWTQAHINGHLNKMEDIFGII